MQSAPFLFVGEPGNFSLLSGGGQQAVQLSRRGRHYGDTEDLEIENNFRI